MARDEALLVAPVHYLGAVEGAEVPGGAVQVRVADAAVLEVEEHVVLAHGAALEAERLEVARGAVAADGEDVDGGGGGRALGGAGGGGHRVRREEGAVSRLAHVQGALAAPGFVASVSFLI